MKRKARELKVRYHTGWLIAHGRDTQFLKKFQDRQREAAENGVDLNEVPDNVSIHSDSSLRVDTFLRFPCSCMLSFKT